MYQRWQYENKLYMQRQGIGKDSCEVKEMEEKNGEQERNERTKWLTNKQAMEHGKYASHLYYHI